jgi:hypothetical protein
MAAVEPLLELGGAYFAAAGMFCAAFFLIC